MSAATEYGVLTGTLEATGSDEEGESLDLLFPMEVRGRYYDEDEFEDAFPGAADLLLDECDDDAWEEYDYDE